MSMRLSKKTQQHVATLFPPNTRDSAADLLLHQCGNNLPFLEKCDEVQLERFRFAALKLSCGDLQKLKKAIELAKQDWRDLIVAAGFGEVDAHKRWSPRKA